MKDPLLRHVHAYVGLYAVRKVWRIRCFSSSHSRGYVAQEIEFPGLTAFGSHYFATSDQFVFIHNQRVYRKTWSRPAVDKRYAKWSDSQP